MKRLFVAALLSLSILSVSVDAQKSAESVLTNTSVVKLVKAGFKDKTIIAIITSRPNVFDLDPEQLIQLKRQGVSENVILAMLATHDATIVVNEDEQWASDEQFFRGLKRPGNGTDNSTGGTNIFGSGGGSQSRVESRGGSGGSQNEGNVTGSATVRILKPPTEAGGATPKLEKTETLNNEGVIRLVEAGFSEGTIIKRIEESPVDFDLSPAKLEELRKRRVTEPIIVAMRAAMGGDPKP